MPGGLSANEGATSAGGIVDEEDSGSADDEDVDVSAVGATGAVVECGACTPLADDAAATAAAASDGDLLTFFA